VSFVYELATLLHSPVFRKLFFKKSFSTFSCPIWEKSWSTSVRSSESLAPSDPLNARSAFSRNSRFHVEIWLGWTSNRVASSERVCCSCFSNFLKLNLHRYISYK
jgi:hypothetical protein